MDTTFIYFLKDPENPKKGYVGKTDRPRKRLSDHFIECRDKTHRRANWLKSLVARKLKPALQVIDEVPFEHWPQLEVAYIEFFLEQGYALVNGTPGGEGVSMTPEIRAKISIGNSGKKPSQETLEKMSAARIGKKRSPETCEKMSIAMSGEKNPMFGKYGDKNPFFGQAHSPETLLILRKKETPETCAKMRGKRKRAKSSFYGVSLRSDGNWRARINLSGKKKHLGYFSDEVEAAEVYDIAAKIHHGVYAVLNFPD